MGSGARVPVRGPGGILCRVSFASDDASPSVPFAHFSFPPAAWDFNRKAFVPGPWRRASAAGGGPARALRRRGKDPCARSSCWSRYPSFPRGTFALAPCAHRRPLDPQVARRGLTPSYKFLGGLNFGVLGGLTNNNLNFKPTE